MTGPAAVPDVQFLPEVSLAALGLAGVCLAYSNHHALAGFISRNTVQRLRPTDPIDELMAELVAAGVVVEAAWADLPGWRVVS